MMRAYRDTVDIKTDAAADGTAEPSYTGTLMASVPCQITAIGGDSTYRGRMLEAHTQYVVEMQYIDGVTPTARLNVIGGIHVGKYLNIGSSRVVERNGQARKLELYCTSKDGR